MAELNLEALKRLVADKIALTDAVFEGSDTARFVAFGYSDAKDILRALERIPELERQVTQWSSAHAEALERAERLEAAARETYGPCPEWPDCGDDEGPCWACVRWSDFLERVSPTPTSEGGETRTTITAKVTYRKGRPSQAMLDDFREMAGEDDPAPASGEEER